jgi:hypothetical protein
MRKAGAATSEGGTDLVERRQGVSDLRAAAMLGENPEHVQPARNFRRDGRNDDRKAFSPLQRSDASPGRAKGG